MKRLLIFFSALIILSGSVFADEYSDMEVQINSLYAANRLEDAYNLLVSIPQDRRTPQQVLLMGNIMMDYGRINDAEFMYGTAISIDPKFYKAHYNLANIYLAQEKPNMAIDSYKLAIKYNKEFAPAHYNLGCAYLKIGDLKKAKSAFLNATFYNPNVADYHYNLAYVYKRLGKEKDANFYLGHYNKLMNNN